MKGLKIVFTVLIILILIPIAMAWQILLPVKATLLNPSYYEESLARAVTRSYGAFLEVGEEIIDTAYGSSLSKSVRSDILDIIEDVLPADELGDVIGEFMADWSYYLRGGRRLPELSVEEYYEDFMEAVEEAREDNDKVYLAVQSLLQESGGAQEAFLASIPFTEEWYDDNEEAFEDFADEYLYYTRIFEAVFWVVSVMMVLLFGLIFVIWHKDVRVAFITGGILLILHSAWTLLAYMGYGIAYLFGGGYVMNNIVGQGSKLAFEIFEVIRQLVGPIMLPFFIAGLAFLGLGIGLLIAARYMKRNQQDAVSV